MTAASKHLEKLEAAREYIISTDPQQHQPVLLTNFDAPLLARQDEHPHPRLFSIYMQIYGPLSIPRQEMQKTFNVIWHSLKTTPGVKDWNMMKRRGHHVNGRL